MARSSPAQQNFNAGELSPLFDGRVDMAKYGNGCSRMRNFIPLPQGPAKRRPGFRYVAATKDSADRSWLIPFVFSEDDAFAIEFGDGYCRFFTDNGQLVVSGVSAYNGATAYVLGDLVSNAGVNYYCIAPTTGNAPPNATYWYALTGTIYEIPSPYALADLTGANGTFEVSYAQTGDTIFMALGGYAPQKLTRVGNTNWQFSEADIKNGPFIGLNPDETTTVYASAATGTVTLTASTSIFTTEKIGTLFLLEQKAIDGVTAWEPAKAIVAGNERRSDSNVYRALNNATTGSVKPVHREGARFDGDTGVQWQYVHSGYGIARITAVAGTTATATVISEIPSQAVLVGNASLRWSFSAWDSVLGYPELVTFYRERLAYARGAQFWFSVSADLENFASRDGAETLPDSAVSLEIAAGQINDALWLTSGDALLVGTRGAEFAISATSSSDAFGPGNAQAARQTTYGSRKVAPAVVGDSVLFTLPSGRRVRDMRFSFNTNGYEANDVTIIADHIAAGKVIQMAFAQEPHSLVWACCENGDLIALTFMLEQDVIGWHKHPVGGSGIVESLASIPSPDGTHDQIWAIVRRTINGATVRYVEYMEKDWLADEAPLRDAVYSDSAATFNGLTAASGITITRGIGGQITSGANVFAAGDVGDYIVVHPYQGTSCRFRIDSYTNPTTVGTTALDTPPVDFPILGSTTDWGFSRSTITNLGYLEGATVDVLIDGAAHPQVVVTGGQIELQSNTITAQIGLPAPCELETMRVEAGATDGTAQGKTKRIHRLILRLYETLGGKVGKAGEEDEINYRDSSMPMNNPPSIYSGDYLMLYPEGYNRNGRIRVINDQPFPMTVIALYPQLDTQDSR
jgi:hypothetical protein